MPKPKQRPVFLDLRRIRQPATAVLSIGHRVSGIVLVLAIPPLVYLFDRSLAGARGYDDALALLRSAPARIVLLLLIWAFAHHLFAGIRYLLIDAEVGADIGPARVSAWLVFAAELIVLVIAGVALP